MGRTFTALLLAACLLTTAVPARSYTFQFTSTGFVTRWPTNTITVAFSDSLFDPQMFGMTTNVKPGTDVVQAARNALRRWSLAANVQFIETRMPLKDVSQSGAGDGVSLITIANTPNNRTFVTGAGAVPDGPGKTRVFTSPTGQITEADIVLNPSFTGNSSGLNWSSDGTFDTFDIESTLVHEVGHLLGLNHSGVPGATMQPRQGRNGLVPIVTNRTLEDDDLLGIRSLYGQRTPQTVSTLQGHVRFTTGAPYGAGAHVWVENSLTGRIHGSSITKSDGSYEIQQLPAGSYRVVVEYLDTPVRRQEVIVNGALGPYGNINSQPTFLTSEVLTSINPGATQTLDLSVPPGIPSFSPNMLGIATTNNVQINFDVALQLEAGKSYRLFIGGDSIDQVPAAGFTTNSPFLTIDTASYRAESGFGSPVVSFDLRVADNAKFGDYSLVVRRGTEVNYFVGGLAIDPYTQFTELNPIDRNDLFVRQQYLDFLFREPDQAGFNAWLNVLNNCSDVNNNPQCDRVLVSSSFFGSPEFRIKGFYVFRFYKLAFGQLPAYAQIIPDMQSVTGQTADDTNQRRAAFANNFVARTAFTNLYPTSLSPTAFVNALMDRYGLQTITTPNPATPENTNNKVTLTRADLIAGLSADTLTRAQVVRAIADSDEVFQIEFNSAFVFMQYVGYLKRDPDQSGFNAWLNYLNTHPTDFRTMVNGFVNALEYRARFGHLP
jgi:Carboxypeptidase regulatory-like domain/Matrixin